MLEELRRIVQRVSSAGNLSEALEIIVSSVKSSLNVSVCSIYLHDQMLDRYLLMATRGLNQEAVGNVFLGPKEGLVGMVVSREETINLERADAHPNYQYIPETGEERYSSFLGVPIIHHRHVLGVLVVQQVDQRRFDEGE
ncbi:MAG: GAF domain-containing protein [Pseudomonadales bacterium]